MALYNNIRPQSLVDVVGNESEIASLQSLFKQGKLPHTILFTGNSGCGKTTLAKIIATMLDAGVNEFNSANTRGIDTARDIIDELQYQSTRPIVYILDEFHQVSKDFANAMLKPFEDCPEHVYFFLCTTDPAKVIAAVKTRCHVVNLKALTEDEMSLVLRRAAKSVGVKVPGEVLEKIIEKSDGSARKALVDLERILYIDDTESMLAVIEGDTESTATIDLCRALLENDWGTVSKVIQGLDTTDWESVRYAVLNYMSTVVLKSGRRTAVVALEFFKDSWYSSGKAGLVYASYCTTHMK